MLEKSLSAAELREAIDLVLDELEDLSVRDQLRTAERLGRLKAHMATILGESPHGIEPIYGLRALRQHRAEAIATKLVGPSPG